MKSRPAFATALVLAVVAAVWFLNRPVLSPPGPAPTVSQVNNVPAPVPKSADMTGSTIPPPNAAQPPVAAQPIQAPRPAAPPPGTPARAARTVYMPPDPTPPEGLDDVQSTSRMLSDYRQMMGENPVGTNAEIMKSLMGGNKKGAMLGPPQGMGLNGNGELVDRWGTPIFFHALSKDHMEIRSAGPDGVMWTGDDVVFK